MTALAAPTARQSRERVIPELLMAIATGECHWPAWIIFDDTIGLLTLQFDTVDQFAAWANHLGARRDRPITGARLIHGAHTELLGWDVALWTYTKPSAADIDVLIREVSL